MAFPRNPVTPTKACSTCREVKPLEEFHAQASKSDGRKAQCKACGCRRALAFYYQNKERSAASRKRYASKPENMAKLRERRARWRLAKPVLALLSLARIRSRRLGLPFDLTPSDVVIPNVCPVLGIPLVWGASKRQSDCSPTLDRVVPSVGYVRGNVNVISWRANRLKSDATADEIARLLNYVVTAASKELVHQTPSVGVSHV